MKKLFLPIPLVLLTFGMVANDVIADDRLILGSFERLTEEFDEPLFGDFTTNYESTLNGFSARLYWFQDNGLYSGVGLSYMTGDVDVCVPSNCASVDTTVTMFSSEIGWDLGQWIPFVGATRSQTVSDEESEFLRLIVDGEYIFGFNPGSWVERTADPYYLNIGLWLELDTFKVRGALNIWDESETPSVSGGVLYQMDNEFAVGAEFEVNLDSEANRFRFSLQFGRSF